jgi:hypothetical protein
MVTVRFSTHCIIAVFNILASKPTKLNELRPLITTATISLNSIYG